MLISYLFSMKLTLALWLLLSLSFSLQSQNQDFSRQDSLRGSITTERAWWDLNYYHLYVNVDPEEQSIKGSNRIQFTSLGGNLMQLDLQPPMKIDAVYFEGAQTKVKNDGNVWYVIFPRLIPDGEQTEISVEFSGHPRAAPNAPWDGGFSWKRDENNKHFIATSCQGDGASLWWPCKDHMYDEPDSMMLSISIPPGLTAVGNGRLIQIDQEKSGKSTFHWFVQNPINNYGVNINIGDYVQFSEKYKGEAGILDCQYYVLRNNLEKAKIHFADVGKMLKAFEHWFGPYPFYEDSYKLVEVPYLGMEHQSSITYGNQYKKGYLGKDMSGTGWGDKFDFIIVHESGHEWFANSITYKDIADMWIHEGFTSYSECLFLDFHYGPKAAADYVIGKRSRIRNDKPIIGPYEVNQAGSSDMYNKAANMLHTLRKMIDNDDKWLEILRGINETFYHQVVETQQIETYLSEKSGFQLQAFFDQYLRDTRIPILEYRIQDEKLKYRWANCVKDFDMLLIIHSEGKEYRLNPTTKWQTEENFTGKEIRIDRNFYVASLNILAK